MNDAKLLLTVPEVAERLGIGRSLTYQLIMGGSIKSITIGKARRVRVEALKEFVDSLDHDVAENIVSSTGREAR